jgi:type IV pilus assembly protein PilV
MGKFQSRFQSGFTLIEILVSLVILSFGLLGIAGMMVQSIKSNSSSYLKQRSIQTASNIIDRIRANTQVAISGSYAVNNLVTSGAPTLPSAPATDCGNTTCTPAQLAAYDTWYWLVNDVAARLPNGCASITTSVSGVNTLVTVTVQWEDGAAQAKLGSATAASAAVVSNPNLGRFVTKTLI